MHIVVIIQDYLPEVGAGPARVSEMAALWLKRGDKVTVVTSFPSRRLPGLADGETLEQYRGLIVGREVLDGVDVLRSWSFTSTKRSFARTVAGHLSFAITSLYSALRLKNRPDVVIASGPPYFTFYSGVAISRYFGVGLVLDIRDLWPDYIAEMGLLRSRALERLLFASERWLLARAQLVSVVTASFRSILRDRTPPSTPIEVVPNGVDLARYAAGVRAESQLWEGPASPDVLRVGYLGTMGAGQGLAAVVEAAHLLADGQQRYDFQLIGDGADRHTLETAISRAQLRNVRLRRPISRNETASFYLSCDIILVPHAESPVLGSTVPSKLFEAMACGRPVLGALRGEGARIIEESHCGIVATPGDPHSIAGALQALAQEDRETRESRGRSGQEYVRERYDRKQIADRFRKALKDLLDTAR
jgi:hypothetical protein